MDLSIKGLETLLKLTANTAEHELTCEESGELVHRYVEHRLFGSGPVPTELLGVEQHLSVCADCIEIVDAIVAAVKEERTASQAEEAK